MEYALTIGLLVLPIMSSIFIGLLIKKFNFSENMAEATRDLMASVMNTYEVYVKGIKKTKGKMTEFEKEQARSRAWTMAKDIASTKGKKFLLTLGQEKGNQMINSIVTKFKKK